MVSQHKELARWVRDVVIGIEDNSVSPQEVELAMNLKEELNAIEDNLVQMAKLKKLEVESEQQVLQTRLVAMEEVRRNLEDWKPVFEEEVNNLKQKAVEAITEEQFQQLLYGDKEVECLPMKAIATLKPPARKKGRVVVCGNYAMERENEELANAASGCDAVGIRATAAKAVERGWTMGAIDVKAAFLQAPRRTQLTRVTVGEPPSLLKAMGLTAPGERWVIRQALYGLIESPGDWGEHRDQSMRDMTWEHNGKT